MYPPVTALGSLGRQLRRSEKLDTAIQLLAPLWPVKPLEEMVGSLSPSLATAMSLREVLFTLLLFEETSFGHF